ncbi:hypothetical protein [Paraburkholderia saeva]|nr:hypothetical protein [Paraburkholderia saeva]
MSSIGLGVGVLGTATYIMWFSRDMQAYERAIQAAREQPMVVTGASRRNDSTAEPVVRALAAVAVDPASSPPYVAPSAGLTPVFMDTQVDAGTEWDASAAPMEADIIRAPSHPVSPAAPVNHHRAASPPKPPTLFSRIASAFRRVDYRHHDPGNDQSTYAHP